MGVQNPRWRPHVRLARLVQRLPKCPPVDADMGQMFLGANSLGCRNWSLGPWSALSPGARRKGASLQRGSHDHALVLAARLALLPRPACAYFAATCITPKLGPLGCERGPALVANFSLACAVCLATTPGLVCLLGSGRAILKAWGDDGARSRPLLGARGKTVRI